MAKKKTPAELKEEGVTLGKIIAAARKRDHNFAMLISADGIVLEADPKKPAAAMRRLAKANGGGAKGAQGILRIQGKVMELNCEEDDPPPMLVRLAKVHFRDRGQMMKVVIKTPSGAVTGDEDDDDDDDEGGGGGKAAAAEAPTVDATTPEDQGEEAADPNDPIAQLRQELLDEFREMQRNIGLVAEGPDRGAATKCKKLAELFEPECANDPKRAVKILSLLRTTVEAALAANPQANDAKAPGGETSTDGATLSPPADSADAPSPETPADTAQTPETVEDAFSAIGTLFGDFWERITAPTEGDIAREAEASAIEDQKAQISALYASGPLTPEKFAQIAVEIMRLTSLMRTAQQIEAMAETHPDAATEARQAMAGFDQELGPGTIVTPELLQQMKADIAAAEAAKTTAKQHMAAADAMPEGPEKEAAKEAALNETMAAQVGLDTANSRLRAAKGKQMLTEAITVGPLSPNAPRPFADQTAAQFVESFAREPELASFAVDTASTSQNPDAIASGMGLLCDNLRDGFGDSEGRTPPADFNQQGYAQNLIRGAGAEGGDYMADAGEYIRSGGHLQEDPVPHNPISGNNAKGWARDRANFISDAAIGPDGTLDVESADAQAALGHLRFNPDVIENPTPSLNAHVLRTYEMLSDPDNQQEAQIILDRMEEPTGAGQMLVERSGGMVTSGNATADDARQAVVTSLMTPVHQGEVGSCFATAGVRRMSETDPMESMARYAELAETGVFRPRNDMDPIPAVLSFPRDEDPLIRSMEYSTATVMAGMEGNSLNELMQNALDEAVDGLMGPVGDDDAFFSALGTDNWHVDREVIRATLIRSFIVEYDSESQSAEQANDGRSNHGGYFLVQVAPSRAVITNKAEFIAALTERVLMALAEDPKSDKGKEIARVIASSDYLDEMMDGESAPWKLGGGGFPEEADAVLFGPDMDRDGVDSGRTNWDNIVGATQGDRTEELLENLLESFEGHDEAMMPVMNNGIHAFNALPNHPSMAALREGDYEDNIESMILAPGREIAAREFSGDECNRLFAETVTALKKWDSSTPRQALMDTALSGGIGEGLTPQATSNAIVAALRGYLDQLSLDEANAFQSNEIAAGRACDNAARDAKQVEKRAVFVGIVQNFALNGILKATAPPVFTIADSNWGDATKDTFIVIAPDPLTGEARMWSQDMPSGRLAPLEEKWVDAEWTEVVVDT